MAKTEPEADKHHGMIHPQQLKFNKPKTDCYNGKYWPNLSLSDSISSIYNTVKLKYSKFDFKRLITIDSLKP